MTVELNHTIVEASDKERSATFLAGILNVAVQPRWGPFVPVTLGGVTLDYVDAGVSIWADPHHQHGAEINHHYGGRGVYFADPDGHRMEIITTPYGPTPE